MNAIIIDDEINAIEILELQLQKHCPEVNVVATFNKPKEAMLKLASLKFDLLFLDIEMPHLNGFDLLEKIEPKNFKIIFTTAYDKFAIKAFKFNAVDYLLKPIDIEDLKQSIQKIIANQTAAEQSNLVQQTWQGLKNKSTKIPVATSEGILFFSLNDIIQIESDGSYSKLFLTTQPLPLLVSKSLAEFDALLNDEGFFRIHHSHLINLDAVTKYAKADGGSVWLKGNIEVPISRTKKEAFCMAMGI